MNNLRTIEKVNSGTGDKLANFDGLIKVFPEILSDPEAVSVINGVINPLGYQINGEYQNNVVKYSFCTPCGLTSDAPKPSGSCGLSCGGSYKPTDDGVRRLVPLS